MTQESILVTGGTGNIGGAFVAFDGDVVAAGFSVELHPVFSGRPANEVEAVLVEMKQDGVADDVAIGRAGDELFGLVDFEIFETIDGEI